MRSIVTTMLISLVMAVGHAADLTVTTAKGVSKIGEIENLSYICFPDEGASVVMTDGSSFVFPYDDFVSFGISGVDNVSAPEISHEAVLFRIDGRTLTLGTPATIYDMEGRAVKVCHAGENDLSMLAAGIYIIRNKYINIKTILK